MRTLQGPATDTLAATPLNFSGQAGVLSDTWNAGGYQHTHRQAAGAVPTSLLKQLFALPGISHLWSAVSTLAPELTLCKPPPPNPWIVLDAAGAPNIPDMNDGKGILWLGHIDLDAVHPDRLASGGKHVCNEAGMCDFEYNASPPEKDCLP